MQGERVNERGPSDEGVWHPQARQLTSQQTRSFRHAPINGHLVHPGEQSPNGGFVIGVGAGEQFGPGDDRVSEAARAPRQPPCPSQMIDADVGVYE
jgi:hypothetical protein